MLKRIISAFLVLSSLAAALCFAGCSKQSDRLTSYDINAVYDGESHTVTAVQTVEYVNTNDSVLSEVCFNLHPNGFREGAKFSAVSVGETNKAYPNGVSYGQIDILSCSLPFEVGGEDMNMLTVELPSELYPDDTVKIVIEFKLTLPNAAHRFGYADRGVYLGNWYPVACVYEDGNFISRPYYCIGDPFYSEIARYRVSLSVPQGYEAAASGKLVSSRTSDGTVTLVYELDGARDFAAVFGENYKCVKKRAGSTDVLYYYTDDEDMTGSLEIAAKAISWFSDSFGTYPYDTFSVVQTDFAQGGMEYPGLVYVSANVSDNYYKEVIVHETAHQWWYGAVGNDQVDDAWLDEGLAEFSTSLFFGAHSEYGKSMKTFSARAINSYRGYIGLLGEFSLTADTAMNKSLAEFKNSLEYVAMTYDKGYILFEDIYNQIGKKNFFGAMRRYFAAAKFKIASKDTLIGAIEAQTGVNYDMFVENYLRGTVHIP